MNCMPTETKILRERIEYLEEELRQIREDISPVKNPFKGKFGLTIQHAALAYALYRHTLCAGPHLDRVTEENSRLTRGGDYGLVMNRTKVAICKLRKTFKELGVNIHTVHGVGYYIDEAGKQRLRKLLKKKG